MKKSTLGALVVGAIIGLGISYIIAIVINITETPEFCGSCHSMKPMVESFHASVHGGSNKSGFSVHHCTDCHLPKDSLIGFLVAKGITGVKDVLAELGVINKVDFKEHFWNMNHYVYDNNCLICHKMVKEPKKAFEMSKESRFAHEFYWKEKKANKDISCVTCHNDYVTPNFAHPNLLDRLNSK